VSKRLRSLMFAALVAIAALAFPALAQLDVHTLNICAEETRTGYIDSGSGTGSLWTGRLYSTTPTAGSPDPFSPPTIGVLIPSPSAAALELTKRDSKDPVDAGETFTYIITVRNVSDTTARDVSVTDFIPPGLTPLAHRTTAGNCTRDTTLRCSGIDLPPGAFATIELDVTAHEDAPEMVTNVATVSISGAQQQAVEEQTTIQRPKTADVFIGLMPSTPNIIAGNPFRLTVIADNAGPDEATGVRVGIAIPDGMTVLNTDPSCEKFADSLACAVLSGLPVPILIDFDTSPALRGTVPLRGTISANERDPNPANNVATTSVFVTAPEFPVVEITKTGSKDDVAELESFFYTIRVTNHGPGTAKDLLVSDLHPAGLIHLGSGNCLVAGASTQCFVTELERGVSSEFVIHFQAAENAPDVVTNTARVRWRDENEEGEAEAFASAQTRIRKLADYFLDLFTETPSVTTGTPFTVGARAGNNGPSSAGDVNVTITPPPGVVIHRADTTGGSCTIDPLISCQLGTIVSGGETLIHVEASSQTTGTLRFEGTITSPTDDPNPANNSSSAQVSVQPPAPTGADLSVTKQDLQDPVLSGEQIQYVIRVFNAGPQTGSGVVVTDTLPPGTSFIRATTSGGSCQPSGQTVTCTFGSFPVNATRTINLDVTAPSQPGTIVNRVTVTSPLEDPDPSNNEATESTTVNAPPPTQSCALGITAGSYSGDGGCGAPGDSSVSCNGPAEVRISNPDLNLVCDANGNCGDDNIVFGQPNHRCTVGGVSGTGFNVDCQNLTSGGTCQQRFTGK
jgi:uncharacterized repeat protein (TIGR01451 family)